METDKLNISNLVGRESDKICHVIGHGPSLYKYLDHLSNLNSDHITVSVNDIDMCTNIKPDYWIVCNPCYNMDCLSQRVNKFTDTKFVYCDVIDMTSFDKVDSLLKVDYFTFDFLHFKSSQNSFFVKGQEFGCQKAWIPCCSRIQDRLTIQELLMRVSGYENHYSTGDTIILHALALGIIIGSKVINLYGVDLDYNKGYVNKYSTNGDSFDFWMDRLQSDFYVIKESAVKLGVTINYFGENQLLKNIFDLNRIPDKVYHLDCKNYD